MTRQKDPSRKIFEAQFGKAVRPEHWEKIKTQMQQSGMPLTPENLQLIAKCKRIASRTPISAPALYKVIAAAGKLGKQPYGREIKSVAFELNEKLSHDKFYRVFRKVGYPFTVETQFHLKDIGDILYKLLSDRAL